MKTNQLIIMKKNKNLNQMQTDAASKQFNDTFFFEPLKLFVCSFRHSEADVSCSNEVSKCSSIFFLSPNDAIYQSDLLLHT